MPVSVEEASVIRGVVEAGLSTYEDAGDIGEPMSLLTLIVEDEPALLFELACFGVGTRAPEWMRDIAQIAGHLRHIRFGFRIKWGKLGAVIVCSGNPQGGNPPSIEIACTGVDVDEVREFCSKLAEMKPFERGRPKFQEEFAIGELPGHNLQATW